MTELQPSAADEPSWMTIARAELGVTEAPGDANDARVQAYFAATSLGPHTADSVPWCSAFANWCMEQAGIAGTGRANARSWLDWGVPLLRPRVGCIVVFSRPPSPANGHVGFLATTPVRQDEVLQVLGGNEGNAVRIAPYPSAHLLGWRWPEEP